MNDRVIEVEVKSNSFTPFEIFSASGVEEIGIQISEMMPNLMGAKGPKKRKMTLGEAFDYMLEEEQNRLLDMDQVAKIAIARTEQMGIVFLDEIDKIAGRESGGHGPMVSREGVQRDLLPVIEGTTVNTKYGMVKTDHILFIGAGAFHVAKPSDMIPELQGRFPIRVELESLSKRRFHPHSHRTAKTRWSSSTRTCWAPKDWTSYSATTPSRKSPPWRWRSIPPRKISAPAACIPSWKRSWKTFLMRLPTWSTAR